MRDGLKKVLLEACYEYVEKRLRAIREAMENAQAAANEETKSSAGDKYETGRAMMQLEKEKLAGQLAEASKMKQALDQIDVEKKNESIGLGSVVKTAGVHYFLSVSVGKLDADGTSFFAVSPASPVGQQLLGKAAGDEFTLAGKSVDIIETY